VKQLKQFFGSLGAGAVASVAPSGDHLPCLGRLIGRAQRLLREQPALLQVLLGRAMGQGWADLPTEFVARVAAFDTADPRFMGLGSLAAGLYLRSYDFMNGDLLSDLAGNGIARFVAAPEPAASSWRHRRFEAVIAALDRGDPAPPEFPTLDAAGRAEATRLVDELESYDIDARDDAERALLEKGDRIVPFLLDALGRTTDPETRARLESLLTRL
jgi:hypothetical protein